MTLADSLAPKIAVAAPTVATTALVAQPAASAAAPKASPRSWKRFAIVAAVALGLGALAWWQPWVAPVPQVIVETVTAGPVSRVLAVNGRIAALQSVDVRSSVPGQMAVVLVAVGDSVVAGDVIARLTNTQPGAQVAQSFAAFDAGLVHLQQAQADAERDRALGGNIPRKTLDGADLAGRLRRSPGGGARKRTRA